MPLRQTARRYTRALFDLATERGQRDPVRADLVHLAGLLTGSPEFAWLITSPDLAAERRQALLREVLGGRGDPLTLVFLEFLLSRRRLRLLPLVCTLFEDACLHADQVVRAEVSSAIALAPAQAEALRRRLEARLGRQVRARHQVDPALLGGFVVQVGDDVLDCSLRTQLERFRQKIISG